MELLFSLQDIDEAAVDFQKIIGSKKVIAFYGEMGAGKTTFIHAICRQLNVKGDLSSPTFSIINEYITGSGIKLYHLDLYRVSSTLEAIDAGVEECLLSGEICMVEWPSKAPALLPESTLYCTLTSISGNRRKLQINL